MSDRGTYQGFLRATPFGWEWRTTHVFPNMSFPADSGVEATEEAARKRIDDFIDAADMRASTRDLPWERVR